MDILVVLIKRYFLYIVYLAFECCCSFLVLFCMFNIVGGGFKIIIDLIS